MPPEAETIIRLDLETALYWRKQGLMTAEEWREYAHRWQTGAPRFELRVCHCDACTKRFPTPKYKAEATYWYHAD